MFMKIIRFRLSTLRFRAQLRSEEVVDLTAAPIPRPFRGIAQRFSVATTILRLVAQNRNQPPRPASGTFRERIPARPSVAAWQTNGFTIKSPGGWNCDRPNAAEIVRTHIQLSKKGSPPTTFGARAIRVRLRQNHREDSQDRHHERDALRAGFLTSGPGFYDAQVFREIWRLARRARLEPHALRSRICSPATMNRAVSGYFGRLAIRFATSERRLVWRSNLKARLVRHTLAVMPDIPALVRSGRRSFSS